MIRASLLASVVFLAALMACGPDVGAPVDSPSPVTDAGQEIDAGAETSDAGFEPDAGADGGAEACPAGVTCVDAFPFTREDDTSIATSRRFDRYGCAPDIDESGHEVIYRITVPTEGFLSAAVTEADGVDVDVHILSALDASACVHRGNFAAKADVTPGTWYVVVDSWTNGAGVALAGRHRVDIGFLQPSAGPCTMQVGEMARVGDGGNRLQMPATGPVVMEAHLVTQEEPAPFPRTETDELAAHYALSQSRTGYVMHRDEPWAPLEGGSFYGAGIGNPALFPVEHEAWYVNMYWTSTARPARGTRMILRKPGSTRAVVVAAGYETGPGDLRMIGGTPEETHDYLGTSHRSTLTLGLATDQSLPFGPRTCTP